MYAVCTHSVHLLIATGIRGFLKYRTMQISDLYVRGVGSITDLVKPDTPLYIHVLTLQSYIKYVHVVAWNMYLNMAAQLACVKY